MKSLRAESSSLPLLLTPQQAAAQLGLSRATVYTLLRKGLCGSPGGLRSIKIGSATRIPLSEIEAFIERQLADVS
ncbi:MAG: helix-turn-helix domain-containing protein [Chloroflexota bacterium]